MAQQALFTPLAAFQSGVYAPGAKATFYLSGSTTPVTVYSDALLTVPHANPLVADAYGAFAQVFTDGANEVKAVISASDDTVLATIDPVPLSQTASSGAEDVPFTPIVGNAATDVQAAIENNTGEINLTKGIGALSGNGFVAKTGVGTFAARTIEAGDGITVFAGAGVGANPAISLTIATQAEAEAGTNNTKGMTPLRTAQAIADQATPVLPIWSDVSGSRAVSTSYQNTDGRDRHVQLHTSGAGAVYVEISSDNSTWFQAGVATSGGLNHASLLIIPDTWYYRINGAATINTWLER